MGNANFTVREFAAADREQVVRLWQEAFQKTFHYLFDCPSAASFGLHFDDVVCVRDRIWVATVERESVAGFVSASGDEIRNLFVHAKHQGHGVGRALLRRAIEELPGVALSRTLTSNQAGCRFYERNGFHEYGREPSPFLGEVYVIYRLNK